MATVLIGNASTGLFLGPAAMPTTIVQNRATGKLLVGFEVFASSVTLAKNAAIGNGFGMSTPVSVTDGGGNTAHDNVDEMQCSAPLVCD